MIHRNQPWIELVIKVILILVISFLFAYDSFGNGTETTSGTGPDYYWVGGTGNWSDLSHWATTSGGATKHTLLPGQNNSVYFDENSFDAEVQEVMVDLPVVTCADMVWTGVLHKPTLSVDSSLNYPRIYVYGSLALAPGMKLAEGDARFSLSAHSGEHTIYSAGLTFTGYILFEGTGATWLLEDDLEADYIGVSEGRLDTRGHSIKARDIRADAELILNNSIVEFSQVFIGGRNIDAGSSTIIGTNENGSQVRFEGNFGVFNKLELRVPGSIELYQSQVNEVLLYEKTNIWRFNHIDKLTLLGDGVIAVESTGSIGSLVLTAGNVYKLATQLGVLQLDSLHVIGTCSQPITLESVETGVPATLEKQSGSVKIEYVNLRDIKVTGGATFMGTQVVPNGDVTGWNLQTPAPRTLYWVGGSGNWYDSSHWSTISGGAGGACVPTSIDNVRFNSASFTSGGQTVTASKAIFVRTIDWSGVTNTPTFSINHEVNIYGSVVLATNMNLVNNGPNVNFLATQSSQTIRSAGKVLGDNLNFKGINSAWTLVDSLTAKGTVIIHQGKLTTNSKNVGALILSILNSGEMEMGASTIRIGSRFVACGPYDAGTSRLILGSDDYDGHTGTVYSGQSLFDVYFGGDNGRFLSSGRVPYDKNGQYECDVLVAEAHEANDLTFRNRATIQIDSIAARDMEIGGSSEIGGNFSLKNLTLTGGARYQFGSSKLTLESIEADGTCSEYIQLEGGHFATSNPNEINYCILKNVSGSSASLLRANNSIDLGGNSGWTISGSAISDLYWVGNGGSWSDPGHWSATSGGVGGACIPSVLTNVHFDQNSFSAESQGVILDMDQVNFKTMDWTGVQFNPTLHGDSTMISCYGSFILSPAMTYDNRAESIELWAESDGQTIDLAGHVLPGSMLLIGSGEWTLTSDFVIEGRLWLHNGILDTDGRLLSTQSIISSGTGLPFTYPGMPESRNILHLRGSRVMITNELEDCFIALNQFVEAGTSTIVLPGGDGTYRNGISTQSSLYDVILTKGVARNYPVLNIRDEDIPKTFHNVIIEGTGAIQFVDNKPPAEMTFNKIKFLDNGIIAGSPYNIDTLIFSAGSSYTFTFFGEGSQVKVNKHFGLQGVSCQPINIKSNMDGTVANIIKSDGIVDGSFLNLHRIGVSGGAQFYAGEGSVDLGGNSGWIFEDAPEPEIGFLGEDKFVPVGYPLILDATHYGSGISYLWNTGETTPAIEVNACGEYSVTVSYGADCAIFSDTISVSSSGTSAIELLVKDVHDASCEGSGYIDLDPSSSVGDLDLYSIQLRDKLSGNVTVLGPDQTRFADLDSGEYTILLADNAGCFNTSSDVRVGWEDLELTPEFLVEVIDATCDESGEVKVDLSKMPNVSPPATIRLVNFETGTELNFGEELASIGLESGEYVLQVLSSSGCIVSLKDTISIEKFGGELPDEFVAGVVNPGCGQKGSISIDQSWITHIKAPFVVSLTEVFSNLAYAFDENASEFGGLPQGTYSLVVNDSVQCPYAYNEEIVLVLDDGECRVTVISPGFGETLTVPFQGLVHIYDHNGRLIRRFDAPGEWDGSDQNGQLVPIGSYLLISDEDRSKIIEVTVIR